MHNPVTFSMTLPVLSPYRANPAIRFGNTEEATSTPVKTPICESRERRISLYQKLATTPVLTGPPPPTYNSHNYLYKSYSDKVPMMHKIENLTEDYPCYRDIRRSAADPNIADTHLPPVTLLPTEEGISFTPRAYTQAPYTLPDLTMIQSLPIWKKQVIEIPIQDQSQFKVRTPEVSPYMDMTPGTIASSMVAAGLQPSEIAEEYQAIWSKEKICRDILQNFSDAHGKTLEGTRIEVETIPQEQNILSLDWWLDRLPLKNRNRIYRVRVHGLGQYDFEKAYVLGASDKTNDETTAGGYGEGLKMISLNLLRDFGARYVRMASANWQMTYTLPKAEEQEGTPTLYNHLEHITKPAQQPSGNVFEFETDKPEVVDALMKATNYFYHPYNPDFCDQTYENARGGIKLLQPEQHGHPYLAMQRYEYLKKGAWENSLPGMNLWLKHKIPKMHVDRDRTQLSKHELQTAMEDLLSDMSPQDTLNLLFQLQDQWVYDDLAPHQEKLFLDLLKSKLQRNNVKTVFPEQFIADDINSIARRLNIAANDARDLLLEKGMVLCDSDFRSLGMGSAAERLEKLAPQLFKAEEEVSKKDPYWEIPSTLGKLVKTPRLTDAEKVRFHALTEVLGLLDPPDAYQKKSYYLGESYKTSFNDVYLPASVLQESSLEKAVQKVLHETLKQKSSYKSEKYSYSMTRISYQFAQALLGSAETRNRLVDLKALWQVSFHPDATELTKVST